MRRAAAVLLVVSLVGTGGCRNPRRGSSVMAAGALMVLGGSVLMHSVDPAEPGDIYPDDLGQGLAGLALFGVGLVTMTGGLVTLAYDHQQVELAEHAERVRRTTPPPPPPSGRWRDVPPMPDGSEAHGPPDPLELPPPPNADPSGRWRDVPPVADEEDAPLAPPSGAP
jgi:hypothetical protein